VVTTATAAALRQGVAWAEAMVAGMVAGMAAATAVAGTAAEGVTLGAVALPQATAVVPEGAAHPEVEALREVARPAAAAALLVAGPAVAVAALAEAAITGVEALEAEPEAPAVMAPSVVTGAARAARAATPVATPVEGRAATASTAEGS
jgi:hypothetical protein